MSLPSFRLERRAVADGYQVIAGVDEVGRGPWAGPLIAAAVVLPVRRLHPPARLQDSKLLSARTRETLNNWIQSVALAWAIGEVSVAEIDARGLQVANHLAVERAVGALASVPDFVLTDAIAGLQLPWPFRSLVRGEQQSLSIAAASILAKVHRDALMAQVAEQFPEYGFERHKGYGTAFHRQQLQAHGPCPLHRRSFGPVAAVAKKRETR